MKKILIIISLTLLLIGCDSESIEKIDYEPQASIEFDLFFEGLKIHGMTYEDVYLAAMQEETPEVITIEEDPNAVIIEESDFQYIEDVEYELVYEKKEDGRYIAKIKYFHITVYGQPSEIITYCVDYMVKAYDTYLSWFELSYVPQVRMHFYYELNQFPTYDDGNEHNDNFLAYQSAQSIFFKMPELYDNYGYTDEDNNNVFVYEVGVHELMHIMQYNANNFSLSFYEEPWLLEALAEYGVYEFNGFGADYLNGQRFIMTEFDDFRDDNDQYEYIYGGFFVEYLLTLKEEITVHDILKNPNLSEYFEKSEADMFDEFVAFMIEKHGVIVYD
jgi:hypothetical protein